jgi:hypothetical protein
MIAGAWSDFRRALQPLSEAQQDALGDALDASGISSIWSSRRCGEWLYKEAVRRGWILGPA